MGTLRYRGEGQDGRHRWELRVRHDGRQVSRSFHTKTKAKRDAQRRAVQIEADLLNKLEAHIEEGTVADVAAAWYRVKERTLSPTTLAVYKRRMDRFVASLGPIDVVDLTGRDLDDFYGDLIDDGKSPAEIQHQHRVVRGILRYGEKSVGLPSSAYRRASPPTHAPDEVDPPSDDTMTKVFAGLGQVGEWGRGVQIAAMTGMRRGELVGLRWDAVRDGEIRVEANVIEPKGGVQVKAPKGRRSRTVKIGPVAAAVFEQQRAFIDGVVEFDTPWVFPDWNDTTGKTPRRPGWLSQMWRKHRDQLGAKGVKLHDLRHWYGTRSLQEGADMASVSAALGHAKVSTTSDIYSHATATGAGKIVAAVEDIA